MWYKVGNIDVRSDNHRFYMIVTSSLHRNISKHNNCNYERLYNNDNHRRIKS